MPLLIAIIVGVLLLGNGLYFGAKQYQDYQTEKLEIAKQTKRTQELAAQKREQEIQAVTDAQQKALEEAKSEIEKLKQESEIAKTKQQQLEQKVASEQQKPKIQSLSISTSEISNYIGGVTRVICANSEGSGFLMNLDVGYVTVTNDHVILGNNWCNVMPENSTGEGMGHFSLNLSSPSDWNPYTDIAILKMSVSPAAQSWSEPISSLNYNLSSLRSCPLKMFAGSPVIVIGYPVFGKQQVQAEGYSGSVSARQVTEGIISGYDTSVESPVGNLPYSNYYVSAKIDSGNSGGIALSKDSNGLCLLGVATWLSLGNFETQGVVQNIRNVFYVKE